MSLATMAGYVDALLTIRKEHETADQPTQLAYVPFRILCTRDPKGPQTHAAVDATVEVADLTNALLALGVVPTSIKVTWPPTFEGGDAYAVMVEVYAPPETFATFVAEYREGAHLGDSGTVTTSWVATDRQANQP